MPHLVLSGGCDLAEIAERLAPEVRRWHRVVLKTEGRWLRPDGSALLVEGVVVEFSRPQHPVALIGKHGEDTIVRLWSRATVERNAAVQRWLCVVASRLQDLGAGSVISCNIPEEVRSDVMLATAFSED